MQPVALLAQTSHPVAQADRLGGVEPVLVGQVGAFPGQSVQGLLHILHQTAQLGLFAVRQEAGQFAHPGGETTVIEMAWLTTM